MMAAQLYNALNALNCVLKMFKMVNFMSCKFYILKIILKVVSQDSPC